MMTYVVQLFYKFGKLKAKVSQETTKANFTETSKKHIKTQTKAKQTMNTRLRNYIYHLLIWQSIK